MPFLLYSTIPNPNGSKNYERMHEIPLAGNTNGLIYLTLQAAGVREAAWILDSATLLTTGGYEPGAQALVVDLTPARKGEVNLFEIVRVAGYSESGWTPVMLVLEILQDDHVRRGTEAARKAGFNDRASPRDRVHTFLYMQGDHGGGSWNWGQVGRVNGPLLWRDAFDHFVNVARMAD